MQSLTDLNLYSRSTLEFQDNRPSGVRFNGTADDIIFEFPDNAESIQVSPNIDYVEIVNYDLAQVQYVVDIFAPAGFLDGGTGITVYIPAGIGHEVSRLTSEHLRIDFWGFTSADQLNEMRDFTWHLPNGWWQYSQFLMRVYVVAFNSGINEEVFAPVYSVIDPRHWYFAEMQATASLALTPIFANLAEAYMVANFELTADYRKLIKAEATLYSVAALSAAMVEDSAMVARFDFPAVDWTRIRMFEAHKFAAATMDTNETFLINEYTPPVVNSYSYNEDQWAYPGTQLLNAGLNIVPWDANNQFYFELTNFFSIEPGHAGGEVQWDGGPGTLTDIAGGARCVGTWAEITAWMATIRFREAADLTRDYRYEIRVGSAADINQTMIYRLIALTGIPEINGTVGSASVTIPEDTYYSLGQHLLTNGFDITDSRDDNSYTLAFANLQKTAGTEPVGRFYLNAVDVNDPSTEYFTPFALSGTRGEIINQLSRLHFYPSADAVDTETFDITLSSSVSNEVYDAVTGYAVNIIPEVNAAVNAGQFSVNYEEDIPFPTGQLVNNRFLRFLDTRFNNQYYINIFNIRKANGDPTYAQLMYNDTLVGQSYNLTVNRTTPGEQLTAIELVAIMLPLKLVPEVDNIDTIAFDIEVGSLWSGKVYIPTTTFTVNGTALANPAITPLTIDTINYSMNRFVDLGVAITNTFDIVHTNPQNLYRLTLEIDSIDPYWIYKNGLSVTSPIVLTGSKQQVMSAIMGYQFFGAIDQALDYNLNFKIESTVTNEVYQEKTLTVQGNVITTFDAPPAVVNQTYQEDTTYQLGQYFADLTVWTDPAIPAWGVYRMHPNNNVIMEFEINGVVVPGPNPDPELLGPVSVAGNANMSSIWNDYEDWLPTVAFKTGHDDISTVDIRFRFRSVTTGVTYFETQMLLAGQAVQEFTTSGGSTGLSPVIIYWTNTNALSPATNINFIEDGAKTYTVTFEPIHPAVPLIEYRRRTSSNTWDVIASTTTWPGLTFAEMTALVQDFDRYAFGGWLPGDDIERYRVTVTASTNKVIYDHTQDITIYSDRSILVDQVNSLTLANRNTNNTYTMVIDKPYGRTQEKYGSNVVNDTFQTNIIRNMRVINANPKQTYSMGVRDPVTNQSTSFTGTKDYFNSFDYDDTDVYTTTSSRTLMSSTGATFVAVSLPNDGSYTTIAQAVVAGITLGVRNSLLTHYQLPDRAFRLTPVYDSLSNTIGLDVVAADSIGFEKAFYRSDGSANNQVEIMSLRDGAVYFDKLVNNAYVATLHYTLLADEEFIWGDVSGFSVPTMSYILVRNTVTNDYWQIVSGNKTLVTDVNRKQPDLKAALKGNRLMYIRPDATLGAAVFNSSGVETSLSVVPEFINVTALVSGSDRNLRNFVFNNTVYVSGTSPAGTGTHRIVNDQADPLQPPPIELPTVGISATPAVIIKADNLTGSEAEYNRETIEVFADNSIRFIDQDTVQPSSNVQTIQIDPVETIYDAELAWMNAIGYQVSLGAATGPTVGKIRAVIVSTSVGVRIYSRQGITWVLLSTEPASTPGQIKRIAR